MAPATRSRGLALAALLVCAALASAVIDAAPVEWRAEDAALARAELENLGSVDCSSANQGAACGEDDRKCRGSFCTECLESSDCSGASMICDKAPESQGPYYNKCVHKPLFKPFTYHDWIGTVLAFVVCALAAGGGIGGGGVLVPVFIAFVGFSSRDAIPLSKATIFGGAIANLILNYPKRHPTADRPLIDYNVSLVLEPMTLAGTLLGVYLNKILPVDVTLYILLMVLYLMLWRTAKKGIELWRKEKAESEKPVVVAAVESSSPDQEAAAEHLDGRGASEPGALTKPLLASEPDSSSPAAPGSGAKVNASSKFHVVGASSEYGATKALPSSPIMSELRQIEDEERKPNATAILILILSWCLIFITSILRGGEGAKSVVGISDSSPWQWLIVPTGIAAQVIITYLVVRRLMRVHERKVQLHYKFQKTDVVWTLRNSILYTFACCLAGIIAGLVGIGGGMMKGPLMLELGMPAEVVAATAAWMILFTSSSTTMQFTIFGLLQIDYAVYYAVLSFVASFIGQTALTYLVKKYRKTSFIVLSIAFVIATSTVFITVKSIVHIVHDA